MRGEIGCKKALNIDTKTKIKTKILKKTTQAYHYISIYIDNRYKKSVKPK